MALRPLVHQIITWCSWNFLAAIKRLSATTLKLRNTTPPRVFTSRYEQTYLHHSPQLLHWDSEVLFLRNTRNQMMKSNDQLMSRSLPCMIDRLPSRITFVERDKSYNKLVLHTTLFFLRIRKSCLKYLANKSVHIFRLCYPGLPSVVFTTVLLLCPIYSEA
jgi:hypothetical protein